MIFFWLVLMRTDFSPLYLWLGSQTAIGEIIKVTPLKKETKRTTLYIYKYRFIAANGKTYTGTRYTDSFQAAAHDLVIIEYSKYMPFGSRIYYDCKERVSILFCNLIVLLFIACGVYLIIYLFRIALNMIYLLQFGEIAHGKYQSITDIQGSSSITYKLFFEFKASDGKNYTASTDIHDLSMISNKENTVIIYDPSKPANAMMICDIPGSIKIDDSGNIHVKNCWLFLLGLSYSNMIILIHLSWGAEHFNR